MPDEDLKLGVVAAALSPDVRSAPLLARKAGFGGLQFDAQAPSLDLTELSDTGRREFRRLLEAQAQQLVGLRHDVGNKGIGPGADVDRELSQLRRVMEAAKGLGTPLVCVDVGPLPAPAVTETPKPTVTPAMAGLILLPDGNAPETRPQTATRPASSPPDPGVVSEVDAALVEVGRLADRVGVVLALRSELSSLAALERALRAADCPWFGVDLDPAAVLGDEWELDETFSRLGPHVRHVRARDALRGAERRTKPAPIGRGGTDWAQLLANLRDADYQGWVTVDPTDLSDRAAAATQAATFLRSLA
jgi:sugar phosphate isomerase/epimerase